MALSQEESESVEDRSTIQILKDTESELTLLLKNADSALEDGDSEGYQRRLEERAELIVKLPDQLGEATDRETVEGRQDILDKVNTFSDLAEKALESGGNLDLGLLLRPKRYGPDDLGPLENLIKCIGE